MVEQNEIIIYQTEDGQTRLQVRLEGDTVWLNQDQMAELFEKSKSTINEHIKISMKKRNRPKSLQ